MRKGQADVWIVLIIIVLVVALGFIIYIYKSPSSSGITGSIIKQTNCREVQIPYNEEETYFETVPYSDIECEDKQLVYKVERGKCEQRVSGLFGLGDKPATYSCKITNLDMEGGTFSMRIGFNIGSQQLDETQNKYIYPQSSETFSIQRDASMDSCYCSEQVPTKQVCRDVIKYRDEQRTRTVTKYKTETQCD